MNDEGRRRVQYDYAVYIDGDDVSISFSADTPLPHLEVGKQLRLKTHRHSPKADEQWLVKSIEVSAVVSNGELQAIQTRIVVNVERSLSRPVGFQTSNS